MLILVWRCWFWEQTSSSPLHQKAFLGCDILDCKRPFPLCISIQNIQRLVIDSNNRSHLTFTNKNLRNFNVKWSLWTVLYHHNIFFFGNHVMMLYNFTMLITKLNVIYSRVLWIVMSFNNLSNSSILANNPK